MPEKIEQVVTKGLTSKGYQFVRGTCDPTVYTCVNTRAALLHHVDDTCLGSSDSHLKFLQSNEGLDKYLDQCSVADRPLNCRCLDASMDRFELRIRGVGVRSPPICTQNHLLLHAKGEGLEFTRGLQLCGAVLGRLWSNQGLYRYKIVRRLSKVSFSVLLRSGR